MVSFNQATTMKRAVFLFFFFVFLSNQNTAYTQVKGVVKGEVKRGAFAFALSFISGASHGTRETLINHWGYVEEKYPDLNPDVWNPKQSWLLKYNDRNPANGRNKKPIWLTDPYHALATINQAAAFTAGVTIAIGRKRPIKHYLIQAGVSALGYAAGNYTTYKRNIFIFK